MTHVRRLRKTCLAVTVLAAGLLAAMWAQACTRLVYFGANGQVVAGETSAQFKPSKPFAFLGLTGT